MKLNRVWDGETDGNIEPMEVSASTAVERQQATLLRNKLIAGDDDIVARVMLAASLATFPLGHKLIQQGDTDDCVYFIITGSTEVRINNRHIDIRSAPDTVGEMAAKKPGEVRTADVIVQSKQLEALVLSGTEFRKLIKDFPAFAAHLDELIDCLSRSKIAQLGEKHKSSGIPWPAISGLAGVAIGAIVALALWAMKLDALYIFWGGLGAALVGFVGMLQLNPDFRYRNIAGMAAIALIFSLAYGSVSFTVTVDGEKLDLPLIDFSVETEQKLTVFGIGAFALLLLIIVMGIFDLKLTRLRETR